jgi:D-alanyl-lipoteichoic acid acyltransferase DltB (MBOAT superfamily)
MAFIPVYIVILFVTILIDYIAGRYLTCLLGQSRHLLLVASLSATCFVLFLFKYFNFITGAFVTTAHFFGSVIAQPTLHLILPIGLSFHTFQSLSYVIEVYKGRQKPENSFITYATYVMFFPQLVAGPIERPQNLLHQFYEEHDFDYDRVARGCRRMTLGFFKKAVVADRLSLYVNDVYSNIPDYNGLQITIATVFFAYQIYCDFSGYSDIALGTADVLGFRLMENFNTPYYSRSTSEFWRRWHISLSTWFRDYVYFPLGGSRVPVLLWIRNILVTFILSGLWHGANWTYVFWGLLNGLYLSIGVLTGPLRANIANVLRIASFPRVLGGFQLVITFALTLAAWVLFRARHLGDALYVYSHFYLHWDWHIVKTTQFLLRYFPVALSAILLLEAIHLTNRNGALESRILRLSLPVRWCVYLSFLLMVALFGVYRNEQFIYFQF